MGILLWGFGAILASYCGSFIYNKAETAQSTWTLILNLLCLIPYTVVYLLDVLGTSKLLSQILHLLFSICVPYYAGFGGMHYIAKVYVDWEMQGNQGIPPSHVYFDGTYLDIPESIILIFIHNIVMFYTLKIIDIKHHGGRWMDAFCVRSSPPTNNKLHVLLEEEENTDFSQHTEDSDVVKERKDVNNYVDGLSHAAPTSDYTYQTLLN